MKIHIRRGNREYFGISVNTKNYRGLQCGGWAQWAWSLITMIIPLDLFFFSFFFPVGTIK